MSLVVLRSWSDGQPPKIRGIAPPDSDRDEVVVPDLNGHFVTAEAKKSQQVASISNSNSIDACSITVDQSDVVKGNESRKSTEKNGNAPIPHPRTSINSSTSAHIPELKTNTYGGVTSNINNQFNEKLHSIDRLSLSRESSVNSAITDSPPSSPICGSRYKSLGPELAATIPRRQIIRETWIKGSDSDFNKKEMSKSTPVLNLSSLNQEDQHHSSSSTPSEGAPLIVKLRSKRNPEDAKTRTRKEKSHRPASYVDTFYGSDGEPKFGDRPASVVGVLKKNPVSSLSKNSNHVKEVLSQSVHNLSSKYSDANGDSPSPLLASSISLELKLAKNNRPISATTPRKFKAVRSFSSEIRRDIHPQISERIEALLLSEKKFSPLTPLQPPKEASLELKPELPLRSQSTSSTEDQFPVHTVSHTKSDNNLMKDDIPCKTSTSTSTPLGSPTTIGSEDVDAELERLRSDSRRSTTSTVEVEERPLLEDSPDGLIRIHSESEMSNTPYSSSTDSSPQFFFKDTRQMGFGKLGKEMNTSGKSLANGNPKTNVLAWTQVPVQCINPNVIIPQNIHHKSDQYSLTRSQQNRRRNFCDELLSDVILQVPNQSTTNVNGRLASSPPSSPAFSVGPTEPLNHDGIIIFDEEEEDELNQLGSEKIRFRIGPEYEKNNDSMSILSQNIRVNHGIGNENYAEQFLNFEYKRLIGLDVGSSMTRFGMIDKTNSGLRIGPHYGPSTRVLTTSDGEVFGPGAIAHAIFRKCKLIYKWKSKQSFPYDPYDDHEDYSNALETIFRSYHVHSNHLFTSQSNMNMKKNSIQWNISIHSGMDKKILRDAALDSGLVKSPNEIRLVNESTASAIAAFQFLQRQNPSNSWGKTFLSVNIGSTFIHTSGYELKQSKLHIIESSDSQIYESPETNFIELFSRVLGREFMFKYETLFQPSWIEILKNFDEMKENFYKLHSECYLFLPISFYIEYQKFTGMEISECVEDNIEEGISWDKNGAIRFNRDLMTDWLQPIINFIKTKLKIKEYDSVVLSGGLANQFIANELSMLLPFVHVYKLPEPELAVVEGLVNIDNSNLTLKSPFSIGVGVMTPFNDSIHPPEKCVTRQGKQWCSDVWDTLIRKGQLLTIGQAIVKRSYVGAQPGQNVLVLPIFKSEVEEPKLVTENTVKKCCEFRFEMNKERSWREIQLIITCYESELIIQTKNSRTDEINQIIIDF